MGFLRRGVEGFPALADALLLLLLLAALSLDLLAVLDGTVVVGKVEVGLLLVTALIGSILLGLGFSLAFLSGSNGLLGSGGVFSLGLGGLLRVLLLEKVVEIGCFLVTHGLYGVQ